MYGPTAFFTCWMPYGIVSLCYIFGGEGFVNPVFVVLPLLASKSSVCWNPMLYVVMNFQVRMINSSQKVYKLYPKETLQYPTDSADTDFRPGRTLSPGTF